MIPTLPDLMANVEDRFTEAAGEGMTEEFADMLSTVFTADPLASGEPESAFLNLLMCAKGCFEASRVAKQFGDERFAGLYHAMGQDMLSKAVEAFGVFMSQGADFLGIKQ